ncbi:30S ribosomal protein S3 [Candidatus Pacearchaeota archaeon CG10_big_fil_rev_8_21_14_0_10_34_76]|nr:MAG: 30S ribosomal protein S3 [Candidatus Pacearchaeota archaeon CG10_big_fil_rev_8_21_14_0_10_34_76]
MDEKKFVGFKEEELGVREYIKGALGKGRISEVLIEYTPVGEKIIVETNRPGLVIGRKGERIEELTTTLKKRFKLDNPHIEIRDITNEMLDAQLVADSIAINLERKGSLKFKLIAYRTLQDIVKAGAIGVEIVLSGKLPGDRAKTWRFSHGYLKKTGDPAKVVRRAMSQARTQQGVVGVKVSILPPDAHIHDRIDVNEELLSRIKIDEVEEIEEEKPKRKKAKKLEAKK